MYYEFRGSLVSFLEEQEHAKARESDLPDAVDQSLVDTHIDIPTLVEEDAYTVVMPSVPVHY